MANVLDLYTRLTGRMAMPTKQSLGYCASTMYYAELEKDCDEEIYKVIDKHEKEDIPIDNFWLASGYSSGEEDNLRYVFNWNRRRFPQPEKFFEEMNRRGINVIPNLKPGILKHHPYIEYFEKENAFIKTPDGKADYYGRWWGGDNLTDWRTLKFNVATIMGMGLSGCANMGCDIGGFAGPAPESELLLRWIQNGIFQPRFTINSANNDNTVTQPWMYEENIPYVRAAYHLRYRMFPYLYSLMAEAHETGMPVMRPLFLEFPEDKRCYTDESLSFMYGSSILVANVLEKGAYWATLDGEQIPRFIIRDAFDEAESGWYYNMSDRTIWVKFPVPKKDNFEVVISKEKFDLIGMSEDE